MIIKSNEAKASNVNLTKIYADLCKTNRSVISVQIFDEIFMFKPLSRMEYKQIVNNQDLNVVEKEDVICQVCTLYPKDYDFANCALAGTPTELAKEIIKNSYVNDVEAYNSIINTYRQEISNDLDAQITCIISEAFPSLDIEEIETWDIEKTAKYLVRAEFILTNLRDVNADISRHIDNNQLEEYKMQHQKEKDVDKKSEAGEDKKNEKNLKGGKKQKIDLEALRKAQEAIPEIDWMGDSVFEEGIDALNVRSDTTPYVFRTGYEDEE